MAAVEEEGIEEEPHALALVGNVLAAGVQVQQVPVVDAYQQVQQVRPAALRAKVGRGSTWRCSTNCSTVASSSL